VRFKFTDVMGDATLYPNLEVATKAHEDLEKEHGKISKLQIRPTTGGFRLHNTVRGWVKEL